MSGDGINWFLTALFNPVFLAFLIGLYFLGKLVGRMVSRPNIWKLLILCYFGVFLFEPLRNLGWVLGGVFLLGFFSGTIRNLPSIVAWADGLGDIVFALKHRNAYEELKRQEERFEEELRRAREEARESAQGRDSQSKRRWREEARKERTKKKPPGGGGRDHGEQDTRDGIGTSQKAKPHYHNQPLAARHLTTLGLNPNMRYSAAELKAAFRNAVKTQHPDVGGSSEVMQKIIVAYKWLKNDISDAR